ncbi:MAG: DMT family transporter [Microgenomates group bacterium]
MNQKLLGSLSILAATVIYAGFGVLSRIVGFTIPLFYQNVTRNLFAALILGIIILANKKQAWKNMTAKTWGTVFIRAIIGSSSFLLFFYTMNHMPIGMTYFLYYAANTIGGYFLGTLFFKERITPMKWIALILAFIGLFFIYMINLSLISPVLVGMALLSGLLVSCWFIIVKKLEGYSAMQINFLDLAFPIIWYSGASLLYKEVWSIPQLTPAWIASLFYGACFVVTGQLIVYGFKKTEAQIGSLIMLAEIPIATLLAYLVYREHITLLTALGGILILVAMTLPELAALKKKK